MKDGIPWDRPAVRHEGMAGTLRDVVRRWKAMESYDDEALLGVTIAGGIQLDGWAEPRTDLWPEHISELAKHLDS